MSTLIVFHYDASGKVHYTCSETSWTERQKEQHLILDTALAHTFKIIQEEDIDLYKKLLNKRIQMRISDSFAGTAALFPHDIVLNQSLLKAEKRRLHHRHLFLIGILYRVLFHACHPDQHVTQVRFRTLQLLCRHKQICQSTITEIEKNSPVFDEPDWLDSLKQIETLMELDTAWRFLSQTPAVRNIYRAVQGAKSRVRTHIRQILEAVCNEYSDAFSKNEGAGSILSFKHLFIDDQSLVFVYRIPGDLMKVVRIGPADTPDAMSTEAACTSILSGKIKTEIFHDHGYWIRDWVSKFQAYSKDASLETLEEMLLSDDLRKVRAAIDQLVKKIRKKENPRFALRLLYSALYYWNNPDKGMCRSVCLEVCAILEDLLTERPHTFPPSQVNKSILRPNPVSVTVTIQKPRNVRHENFKSRVQWACNGYRKKTFLMTPERGGQSGGFVTFNADFPVRSGWIHYAVQYSTNNGKTWHWEGLDENSHGLLKYVADERGQRVLSFYADTFNLKLDENSQPVRDNNGLYVFGTFDDIADQLKAVREEGYTRIYPLGALELGWAGEAGPDPSVFSVWDGRTVREDLGGLPGLLRLRQKADELGMKILLCALSHFSRANVSCPYEFPCYIQDKQGRLTPRAGWDGEWSEWLDSFMVNMRDFENVDRLAAVGTELAELGFGLRIDVGHGFDTVFPVAPQIRKTARLLGQVTEPGFEPVDLRKTEEPNIALLYMCYRIQKAVPNAVLVYSEQWHGNETRMLKSGTIPYNSLIKNMEHIRSGQAVSAPMGIDDNLLYLNAIYRDHGGQSLSLFNSHDEESPASNYQNMIWPAAAFLALSSYGPMMYHISRLPGPQTGSMQQRFDLAYMECWKHWVNNRFRHPWHEEQHACEQILRHYPILRGFGKFLRGLYQFVDQHPALARGSLIPLEIPNGRTAAFLRGYREQLYLCVFNFPNPNSEEQTAVARNVNFLFSSSRDSSDLGLIKGDCTYEIIERYNNAEGRTKRSRKEFWSGHELLNLGFGGLLEPVSSYVYELIEQKQINRQQLLVDSLSRYMRYGKSDRICHTYVAQEISKSVNDPTRDFSQFSELFVLLATWIVKKRKYCMAALASLLAEISENDRDRRNTIIEFLIRIAVNIDDRYDGCISLFAADILHGMNLGTIVLISPESQYSGSAGGVGIYTTDIADVLSELGFHIIVVTPLYEAHRDKIIKNYAPHYDGHTFTIQFPEYDEQSQSIRTHTVPDAVNILRSDLVRYKHGKQARVEVLYLENGKYLDVPYGGSTAEDKLRRARVLSQGALEAIRAYNYYPTIIQTNEWPTWLLPLYLKRWTEYNTDPHFSDTRVASMMHNPHPSYCITMNEANPFKRYFYCLVLGLDAVSHADLLMDPQSSSGYELNLMYLMLKTSDHIGTVSRAMRSRILAEPGVFGHADLFQQMNLEGRFFGRRNGFNMAARQRFWFSSQKSILETYDPAAKKRLFTKYTHAKKLAKTALQNDPHIRLHPDDDNHNHVIFSMLHRICKQKGFELLLDWKVYQDHATRWITYEPWKMMGQTVLEYFLSYDPRIQFVVCGRVEDSFDGRRFDMHFRRIASMHQFQGSFAYFPEGALPPSLYRNVYVGSQYFVMPSGGEVGEPCGISQQEAHAGGTPVVAHHQDGLIRTVCDADFGDTETPPNGVKFSGFTGTALLEAMLDAVEIYYHGRRLHYYDKKRQPKKLKYSTLSYNAFNTDHRWLRLLRDYIHTYCDMVNIELPENIDAIRLIASAREVSDHELPNLILREGMKIPDAAEALIDALSASLPDVQKAASELLDRLCTVLKRDALPVIEKRLAVVAKNPEGQKIANQLLENIVRIKTTLASRK